MGSVDNGGGIAKGDPMKKGKKEGSEELEKYDDYYDDLEACNDGNRRACRNSESRQQLYEDMLVEKEKKTNHNPDLIFSKLPSQCTIVHVERGECTTLPLKDRYVGALCNMMRYLYIYCNHYYGTG
jgi:hypothetical protein